MVSFITKLLARAPCSVCGIETTRHDGWYLVTQDRWRDQLKIFKWHAALATQGRSQSACNRPHLKLLIAYFLDQSSFRLGAQKEDFLPSGSASRDDARASQARGHLLGELSIFRDAFAQEWAGTPEMLDSIVDALIPVENGDVIRSKRLHPFPNPYYSPFELSLH